MRSTSRQARRVAAGDLSDTGNPFQLPEVEGLEGRFGHVIRGKKLEQLPRRAIRFRCEEDRPNQREDGDVCRDAHGKCERGSHAEPTSPKHELGGAPKINQHGR